MLEMLRLVLFVLAFLVAVPALTGGAVEVRGGFFRAAGALLLAYVVNVALWVVLVPLTVGGIILGNLLTFGIVALLVNGLAIFLTGRMFPGLLYVRSYLASVGAAVVLTLATYFIHLIH